ncbi:glycoside hydrolase family 9 protein [Croceitalea rosinachiae]|uniref:Glycoside hydrolase family 9 protein n=1 Tax=Croceitalea rosinachiae TaxID=3075596 RepID=A0ABU3ABI0_9FLAO|nr:glycoside hydrolase family 9 protein [Croceitalea sp. F388]MDT0606286.1 glycoside hydrolase family 9 protein [Croceitalea sp. F388]
MKYLPSFFFLTFVLACNTKKPPTNDLEANTGKIEIVTEKSKHLRSASDLIRLNQLGYFSNTTKIGSFVGEIETTSFTIIDLKTGKEVFAGNMGEEKPAELSGETIRQFDFSGLKQLGTYQIKLDNELYSHPFEIGNTFYDEALIAVAKSYYYQRAGSEITDEHGGRWKRPAGHLDQKVEFHSDTKKGGFTASPKGWYDAGDFGKYISNGSFSAGQLLYTLERYPNLYPDGSLNIPESGNSINDLLDEIKYEADWIATMQDKDGGVFHKLTTKRFSGAIMPDEGDKTRFIMPKSSTATFDFAAFLAKMARHYKTHDEDQAQKWLTQAKKAWEWGSQNPNVNFKNPDDVVTGEYGDDDSSQEQFWAAAELYACTGEQEYLNFIVNNIPDLTYANGDGWQSFMRYLGVFTLLNDNVVLPTDVKDMLKKKLIVVADDLTNRVQTFDYQQGVNDFQWGSNSDVQNVAFVIGEAHHSSPNPVYVDAVLSSLNYLFGHNGTGYSMVTGIGDKPPLNVHHRHSKADSIVDPVPGFVCGGPNDDRQDGHEVDYPENASQMHSYKDVWESYASNEVCLNWNAPTPYIIYFAIEAGKSK